MLAHKRLQREIIALQKESPQFIRARPLESDILTFFYVIEGPPDSPYAGGHYLGKLCFPAQYPLAPPSITMITPNGRFAVNTRLCVSMSDFHPETWNPVWSVSTILTGLLSFMLEDSSHSVGSISTSVEEKRRLAALSLEFNVTQNREFLRLFPELVEKYNARKAAEAAAQDAAAVRRTGVAASPSASPAAAAAAAAGAGAVAGAGGVAGAGAGQPLAPLGSSCNGMLILVALLVMLWFAHLSGGQ